MRAGGSLCCRRAGWAFVGAAEVYRRRRCLRRGTRHRWVSGVETLSCLLGWMRQRTGLDWGCGGCELSHAFLRASASAFHAQNSAAAAELIRLGCSIPWFYLVSLFSCPLSPTDQLIGCIGNSNYFLPQPLVYLTIQTRKIDTLYPKIRLAQSKFNRSTRTPECNLQPPDGPNNQQLFDSEMATIRS